MLVFDNFEQLVSSAPDSVGVWMDMAPEARFLVTSREALRLTGEQVCALLPLTAEEGVTLFELRARSAGAHWENTSENQDVIKTIVQQLDCLPLAIELAAARARMLPPKQLRDRLSERFKLLRDGRRGAA